MRLLLWLLTLAALAVGLALAARYNDGYVLMVLPPWRMELSLNLLLLVQVLGFAGMYVALRLISYTLRLPTRVREYRARKRREQAERALGSGLRYFFEGRYSQALKNAASAHLAGHAPGLAALLAARAAHAMRDVERESEWLQRAAPHDAQNRHARLMTEAELHLNNHRHAEALGVVDVLLAAGQRHIAALRLALRAHQALGHWHDVVRLVRQLERHRALSREQAKPIRLRAHLEIVRSMALDAEGLVAYWRALPAEDRRTTYLAAEAVQLLIKAGDGRSARLIIEDVLDEEWDAALLSGYADCNDGDVLGRIAQAEKWLKQQPHEAALLLVLGRLCRQQQLWGKAQSYLEASLALQVSRAAHVELARLLDHLERPDEANRHYRAAALLG